MHLDKIKNNLKNLCYLLSNISIISLITLLITLKKRYYLLFEYQKCTKVLIAEYMEK